MTTRSPGPDAGSHATHDRLLIAAHAAGDLTGPELTTAGALLASCSACRTLHGELIAIAAATRHLPAPVRPASLDFQIAPDRAAALVRGRFWRRLLQPFGRSGNAPVRPLAAAFTTLGLAGLMVLALPTLQLGSGGAAYFAPAAGTEAPGDAQAETFGPEVAHPGDLASPIPTGRDTAGGLTGFGSSPVPAAPSADDKAPVPTGAKNVMGDETEGTTGENRLNESDRTETGAAQGPGPLLVLSLGFLGLGLGLLLLRQVALRLR